MNVPHWIATKHVQYYWEVECSECHAKWNMGWLSQNRKICRRCGAVMERTTKKEKQEATVFDGRPYYEG